MPLRVGALDNCDDIAAIDQKCCRNWDIRWILVTRMGASLCHPLGLFLNGTKNIYRTPVIKKKKERIPKAPSVHGSSLETQSPGCLRMPSYLQRKPLLH